MASRKPIKAVDVNSCMMEEVLRARNDRSGRSVIEGMKMVTVKVYNVGFAKE